jgi:hypothetical protein
MRQNIKISIFIIFIACLTAVFAAAGNEATAEPALPGDSITLPPSADTHITNMYPDTNYGGANYLELWYEEIRLQAYGSFLLFRFELQEALGPEAIIDSAILELYQIEGSGAEPVSVTLHPILESWQENTVTWNNQPEVYTGPFSVGHRVEQRQRVGRK